MLVRLLLLLLLLPSFARVVNEFTYLMCVAARCLATRYPKL
jgi:hypothetical protein